MSRRNSRTAKAARRNQRQAPAIVRELRTVAAQAVQAIKGDQIIPIGMR